MLQEPEEMSDEDEEEGGHQSNQILSDSPGLGSVAFARFVFQRIGAIEKVLALGNTAISDRLSRPPANLDQKP